MNFTIIGVDGFIGSHVQRHLLSRGADVRPIGKSNIDQAYSTKGLGHVVYAAGLTADFRSKPYETVAAHVTLASELLMKADFDSFLYLSSTRVYQNAPSTAESESLLVRPHVMEDLYNLTKLTGESICRNSGRNNVRIARLSNVVGPGEHLRGMFLGQIITEAKTTGHIFLQSDPGAAKDYIWIDDAVSAIEYIATAGRSATYNVARGVQTTNEQWVHAICNETGSSLSMSVATGVGGFPPISTALLRNEFTCNFVDPLNKIAEIVQ